jgi:hypothetical protein
MARYRPVDMSPRFLPVVPEEQLVPGILVDAAHRSVDVLDLSAFDAHYRNARDPSCGSASVSQRKGQHDRRLSCDEVSCADRRLRGLRAACAVSARSDRQRGRTSAVRPTPGHGGAGVRQSARQQRPTSIHAAGSARSRWPVEAVRIGPQHREVGECDPMRVTNADGARHACPATSPPDDHLTMQNVFIAESASDCSGAWLYYSLNIRSPLEREVRHQLPIFE